MSTEYYEEKARDIVWGNIDTNKLLDDKDFEKSVTNVVAELLKIIGELDERLTNLERRMEE